MNTKFIKWYACGTYVYNLYIYIFKVNIRKYRKYITKKSKLLSA
jgi:hypothetical protein